VANNNVNTFDFNYPFAKNVAAAFAESNKAFN
jgi:hypothetical protein